MYEIPGLKYEIGGFDDEPHERLLNNLRDLMDIRDLIKPARRHLFFQNIGVKSSSTAKNSIRPTNSRDLRCDFIGAGDLEISSADEIDDRENLKDNILPVGCNNRYKISSSVLCSLYSFMRCFTALSMTNSRKNCDAVILSEAEGSKNATHAA